MVFTPLNYQEMATYRWLQQYQIANYALNGANYYKKRIVELEVLFVPNNVQFPVGPRQVWKDYSGIRPSPGQFLCQISYLKNNSPVICASEV